MRRFGLALLFAVLWHGRASAEPGDAWEGGEEGDAPAPAETAPPLAAPKVVKPARVSVAKAAKAAKPALHWQRKPRKGAKLLGAVVPDELLRPTPPPHPSGNLHLFVLATRESLKVNIYNEDGSYNIEALHGVSHLLRCKRTGAEKEIEPRLMTILSTIYDHFGEKRLEIVSGFRNQVRTTSYHFKASASDIRIAGIKPIKIRDYADSLDAGGMGVGLYPRSEFVHVDVRPLPSYRWIDYARSDPDAPDKRPPRGWKRKKLNS
jgi:uncharacterized protein YcbK (DUF882 family)